MNSITNSSKKILNPIRHRIIKNKIALIITIVFVYLVKFYFESDLSPDLYFMTFDAGNNNSCYMSKIGDVLKSANDWIYSERSIFFLETSCRGDLTVRQLCAVESAARYHPERQIYVLFTSPINETTYRTGVISALNNVPNVMYLRVHLPEFAIGSPLESLFVTGALNRSRWKFVHTADVLRYLLMYKYGGLYLDLDCLVAKPLSELGHNWATAEGEIYIACAILAFGRDKLGRALINTAISDLARNYRGDVWGQNGPIVVTRVLRKLCGVRFPYQMTLERCKGFRVLKKRKCFPIPRKNASKYFEKRESITAEITDYDNYIYHVYNTYTSQFKVEKGSPYEYLAKKHCPITYSSFNIYTSLNIVEVAHSLQVEQDLKPAPDVASNTQIPTQSRSVS